MPKIGLTKSIDSKNVVKKLIDRKAGLKSHFDPISRLKNHVYFFAILDKLNP